MPSLINATTTAGVAVSGDNSGVLALQTNNGTTAVTIDTSQNVGIGTASPNAPLHVTRSTGGVTSTFANTATNNQNANVNAVSDNATAVSLRVFGSAAGSAGMLAANSTMLYTSAADLNLVADNGSGVIKFAAGGTAERMRIDSSGNVGIGTSSPSRRLMVEKSAGAVGFGSPYVQVGAANYANGGYYTIGFGYVGGSYTNAPAEIGAIATDDTGGGKVALTFATRDVTTNTAPTERMRIDSSGRVTTPSQPVFRASLSADVLISTTSPTKIPYNVVDFNVGSNFNTTTNRFTAPIAGKYLVCVTYNVYNVAGGSYSRSSIYLNGGLHQHLSMNFSDVTNDHVYTGSMIMNLGASDYVEVFTESNDSSYSLSGTFVWNTFSGYLLG